MSAPGFANLLSKADEILSSLNRNAYVVIENAISDSDLSSILAETSIQKVRVNPNDLGSSFHGPTQFFTNIIAHSKIVHDLIISPFVLDICSAYLGSDFQLVNNRIQTTRANIAMPWHTDNNLLINGKLLGRHNMPGLQFVLYLTNISSSPFQLIKDSHQWSLNHKSQYLTDKDIRDSNLEVVELTPSPGSLLILNTHLFHRAAPFTNSNYTRSILLFQADQISPDYPEHGEKLLVNTEFLSGMNPRISTFLGFGRKRCNPPFPESSSSTLNLNTFLLLQLRLFKVFPHIIAKQLLKKLLPHYFLTLFKNLVVANRTSPSTLGLPSNPYLDS